MFNYRPLLFGGTLVVLFAGCDNAAETSPATTASAKAADEDPNEQISSMMDAMNTSLAAQGADYRAVMAEWIAGTDSDEAGNTILQKDLGNKQLSFDFVPGDARRAWSSGDGNALTYAIDETPDATPPFGGLTGAETDAAIQSAMETWDAVTCSDLGLNRAPTGGIDVGVIANIFVGGGSPFVFADVQHAGFTDLNFIPGVLGVAFTFGFISAPGVFTDIDDNGKLDTAFREIYYDPSWLWTTDGTGIDVESIALHEAGHGLSQAHFGNIMIKNDGSFKPSPRAVMNAFYPGGIQRDLLGTDNGGHCSNWAQWPNN